MTQCRRRQAGRETWTLQGAGFVSHVTDESTEALTVGRGLGGDAQGHVVSCWLTCSPRSFSPSRHVIHSFAHVLIPQPSVSMEMTCPGRTHMPRETDLETTAHPHPCPQAPGVKSQPRITREYLMQHKDLPTYTGQGSIHRNICGVPTAPSGGYSQPLLLHLLGHITVPYGPIKSLLGLSLPIPQRGCGP